MCSCVEIINDTRVVKARKDYRDGCMDWIMESLYELRRGDYGKLTFTEWRLIAESIRDRWLIKKGQPHEVQVNKGDGHIYSFRSKIGIAAICHKYELFTDCC